MERRWTDYVDLDEAVDVAEAVGMDIKRYDKHGLITDLFIYLMKNVNQPHIFYSEAWDDAHDFYIECHEAISEVEVEERAKSDSGLRLS